MHRHKVSPPSNQTAGIVNSNFTSGGSGSGSMLLPVVDKYASDFGSIGCSDPPVNDDEYERVELWLDAHPDFVQDYLMRKVPRAFIDGMYDSPSSSPVLIGPLGAGGGYDGSVSSTAGSTSTSRTSSGANTPVRKISAQEFERNGQVLKPMVQTVDGLPSFLGPIPTGSMCSGAAEGAPIKFRRSRSELKILDEHQLMYELIMDISNDLDITRLCHKILQNVSFLLDADRCSLFLVHGERGQDNCFLVSQLFDVGAGSSWLDSTKMSQEIRVPWGTGIIGHVAMSGEALNIPDAYQVSLEVGLLHVFLLNSDV